MRIAIALLGATAALSAATLPATAAFATAGKNYTVKMLNNGPTGMMQFDTQLVRVKPGDSVTFVPADPGHNAESIPGMEPAGAEPFKGQMSKPLTVTFAKPGVYGFRCMPHFSMGMVGVVVVGNPVNLAEAKALNLPGRPKQIMSGILASIK
jgi:pseudoazurin